MDWEDISNAIRDGEFDKELDALQAIIEHRRKIVRTANLKPGVRVRFENLRPKYLTQERGTFLRVEGDRAVIKLDDTAKWGKGYGRYYSDELEIKAPMNSVVPVEVNA